MKVTLLYSKYLTDPTGASAVMRFLKQGSKQFHENSIDIEFFTRDDILPLKNKNLKIKKQKKHTLKERFVQFLGKQSKNNPIAAVIHRYIRTGRAAKILINRYNRMNQGSDIIFIHELETCYEYLKSRKKNDRTKVVLVLHENGIAHNMTLIEYPSLRKSFFYKKLHKTSDFVFKKIDKLGFVSESSMKTFAENNPDFPIEKLFYNLNGIPSIETPTHSNTIGSVLNICCVGTVNERKGQRHIVKALNQLSSEEKEKLHINVVGDGEIKEELEFFCESNSLSKHISFLGKRSDIVDILSQNQIFILPSHNEGLPISILEAMRQGLPIISTKVGGIPEMIEEGKTGIFIEPNTESILRLFKNITKYDWKEMGKESKQLFEFKFSLKSMIDKYSAIFHEVMND